MIDLLTTEQRSTQIRTDELNPAATDISNDIFAATDLEETEASEANWVTGSAIPSTASKISKQIKNQSKPSNNFKQSAITLLQSTDITTTAFDASSTVTEPDASVASGSDDGLYQSQSSVFVPASEQSNASIISTETISTISGKSNNLQTAEINKDIVVVSKEPLVTNYVPNSTESYTTEDSRFNSTTDADLERDRSKNFIVRNLG